MSVPFAAVRQLDKHHEINDLNRLTASNNASHADLEVARLPRGKVSWNVIRDLESGGVGCQVVVGDTANPLRAAGLSVRLA